MIRPASCSVIRRLRGIVLPALLLPFVLLSMIAPGVMPGRAPDGSMVLVLCTPDGPQEVALDARGQPVPADHKADPRCDWAQGQMTAAFGAAPGPTVINEIVSRAVPATAFQSFRPAHDPRGIFARGPPVVL